MKSPTPEKSFSIQKFHFTYVYTRTRYLHTSIIYTPTLFRFLPPTPLFSPFHTHFFLFYLFYFYLYNLNFLFIIIYTYTYVRKSIPTHFLYIYIYIIYNNIIIIEYSIEVIVSSIKVCKFEFSLQKGFFQLSELCDFRVIFGTWRQKSFFKSLINPPLPLFLRKEWNNSCLVLLVAGLLVNFITQVRGVANNTVGTVCAIL